MQIDLATTFLEALGGSQLKVHGSWLQSSCVLAKFTHAKGHDTNPSFGLSVQDDERSNFNCYACRSGSAEELLQSLEMYWGKEVKNHPEQYLNGIWVAGKKIDFKLARQCLDNEEILVKPLPEYSQFGNGAPKSFEEWPQHYLLNFPPALDFNDPCLYLSARKVTDQECDAYDLRWDSKRRMVVMPYKTVYGKLAGARGRAIDNGVSGWKKHYDFTWNGTNNASLCWYNEPSLQLPGPVVVVEGQFDALRVAKVYPKVVANMTARPTPPKMRKLLQTDGVIHIPDTDATGIASIKLYRDYCERHGVRYNALILAEGAKDPGDCAPEYLADLLQPVLSTYF